VSSGDPTSDEILHLPPGGGAVAASGTGFDIDLNTGTAGTTLPLALPAGPNGIRPELTLRYHSGAGADWLGLGWSLNLPRITMCPGAIPGSAAAQPTLDGVGPLWPRTDAGWLPKADTFGQRIDGDPASGWQLTDLADTVHSLGASQASRITGASGATVAWLLDSIADSTGNTVSYDWEGTDGNLRLAAVSWGRYQLRLGYEPRPDALCDGSLGVLLAIRARLAAIELHRTDLGAASLLRSWLLGYDDGGGEGRSLLASVAQFAHAADGTAVAGASASYHYTQPGQPSLRVLGRLPVSVRQPGTQFVDLDGDGLPDLLDLGGGQAQWWRNTGGGSFAGPNRPREVPAPARASPQTVAFADADGDGAVDLLVMSQRFTGYYPLDAAGTGASSVRAADAVAAPFGQPVAWRGAPSFQLDDPLVRLIDLDGDGRTDLLAERRGRWEAWLQADGGWAADPSEIAAGDRPPVSLADPRVSFADLNGDGGLDIVRVTGSTLTCWPNLGPRRWGQPVTVTVPQAPARLDPQRVLLTDVDGDGCADLVYVDDARVLLWLWAGTERLTPPRVVAAIPPTSPGHFRLLDLDGTGTPGLLLDLPNGKQGFVDLLGGKPYLLDTVSDTGATTRISWRTSTAFAADDAAAGRPWRTFHPFPVYCVSQVTSADASTGVVTTTRYRYHEARYDPQARALVGFATVDRDDLGDATIPTRRSTTTFHVGLDPADPARPLTSAERLRLGALRRKPLTVTVSDPDTDTLESVVSYTYALVERPLAGGRTSLLPYTQTTVEQRWEGQSAPVSTHTVDYTDVDDAGMVLQQRSVVRRPGLPPDRDVTIYRSMATGGANLRLPCRTREVDADGTVLADTLTYYDGPAEQGLPLGGATQGLVTRIEDLALTDALVTAVWGATPPDLGSLGYHRIDGEDGWWIARSRLRRDPATPTVLATRGPLGGICLTELDPTGHDVVALTDPLGHRQIAEYDPRTGNVTTLTSPDGSVRRESFDPLGRVTGYWAAVDPAGGPTATWSYDTASMPVRVTATGAASSADPVTAVSYLDGQGGTLLQLTPTGDSAQPWLVSGAKTPNARGQVAASFLPYPADSDAYVTPSALPHTGFTYDLAGRLLSQTRADGTLVTWTRSAGSVTVTVRPAGATSGRPKERHLLDGCGQVLSVGRWDGTRWVEQFYTWDHRGMPVTITTPDGVTHTLVHDLLGRMISHGSPDTGTTRRLIDAQGCEVRTVLATGAFAVREFDEIGRQVRLWRTGSGDPDVVWEYLLPADPAPQDGVRYRTGRLWRATDPLGTLTLAYDAAGRVVSKSRSAGHVAWEVVTDAEYDTSGRLTAVVLPTAAAGGSRRRVEYTHDAIGRPVAATGIVDDVTFDVFGRATQIFHGNGVVTSLRYDPVTGQLLGQSVTGPDGEVLRDQSNSYDDEHRLAGVAAQAGETGWNYAFDGLGRLGTATPSDTAPASAFSYSDGGNMLTGPLGQAQAYVPGTGRLATVAGQSYAYDDAGRMTAAPWGELSWDADDNLLSVVTPQATVAHTYDHTGSRVMSQRDGATYYLQAGDDLVLTRAAGNVLLRFAGAVVATAAADGSLSWLHPDVLGNVTLVTGPAGEVSARLALDPWGNVTGGDPGPAGTGFLGNAADPTGLICLGQRWYDPRTGRFLSPDPVAGGLYTLGAWNAYAYALNCPVLLSDPSGLMSIWAIAGIAAVIALVIVLAVATGGAALAGTTVLGVTFSADGVAAGTLISVGIGAFGGALAGGMSADKAGGDVMLGALVGGIIGGATALIGGSLGAAAVKSIGGAATWSSYAISGGIQGAIGGFGSGFASGFAGGKGSLDAMLRSATRGMIWGAVMGMAVGAFVGGKFANANPDEHNYLEFGTLHKYGIGYGANTTDLPSDFEKFDSSVGTAWDAGMGVRHALDGTFSPGGDILGNFIDVSNVPRDVGADLGFFTTDIPGTLFAIDANAVAVAFANNGAGAALAAASVGADVAGFSYADQVMLGLKGIPAMIGNTLGVLDDYGVFDHLKQGFNSIFGSSSPDS
jgi:RHS repeat-associated protein